MNASVFLDLIKKIIPEDILMPAVQWSIVDAPEESVQITATTTVSILGLKTSAFSCHAITSNSEYTIVTAVLALNEAINVAITKWTDAATQ